MMMEQLISRADVANGILFSVWALAVAIFGVSGIAVFAGLRLLGLPVAPGVLLVPLLITVAFSAIYAGVLLATYLFPNGLLAAVGGRTTLLALLVAGNTEAAQPGNARPLAGLFFGILPKLVDLHREAMRLGGGAGMGAVALRPAASAT